MAYSGYILIIQELPEKSWNPPYFHPSVKGGLTLRLDLHIEQRE